jgi:hypothetical protein
VKKRQLALTFGSLITGIFILFSSCKKINEATELGGGLIPPVDNINTFDTTITVEAYNDLFAFGGTDPLKEDSSISHYTDEQFLGFISSDPYFGKTDARMFLELKPPSYKYAFANRPDSLFLDSVVLVLDYVETYGDTLASQTVKVFEIPSEFKIDTYYVRKDPFNGIYGMELGSKTFKPEILNDSVKAFLDTTANQLRIKLDNTFGQRLLNLYDSAATPGHEDAYSSDSAFRVKFKGFVLQSVAGGNAIMGFNLQGATKLAIYYKYLHGQGTDLDTTVDYFPFSVANSASANYINRDYGSTPLLSAQGGTTADPVVYIQNTPGSFATIKIPDLAGLNNRVVHRAELIAEQVYDVSDSMFRLPAFLYLDAFSPTISKYRNIPYDVIYDFTNGTYNFNSFGVVPVNALDGLGNVVRTWHFNLTRYVQHIVNDTEPLYDLRLFAPFREFDQYFIPAAGATALAGIPVLLNPTLAKGRVRLAGGTPGPQRMRLRIVYSKL